MMRSSILRGLFAGGATKSGRMLMSTMASSPWLMLPPGRGSSGDMIYNFYSLAEDRRVSLGGGLELAEGTRFVGSSHGWLALFNERNNNLFLTNPVSGRRINLPPTPTDSVISRVVLSCSPDADDYECRAMMSFSPADRLAFCLPGRSTAWTPIGTEAQDFVYSLKKECLFCMRNSKMEVEGWDLSNPERPRIGRKDSLMDLPRVERYSSGESEQRYLVHSEQSDQLYVVRRHMIERVGPDGKFVKDIYYPNLGAWDNSYPYKTVGFDVHEIDNGKVAEVCSLDGVAIFIGINHGLVVEEAAQSGVNANSVYFTDNTKHTPPSLSDVDKDNGREDWPRFVNDDTLKLPKWVDTVYSGHDIGIFDYKNKTFSPCFYPCDVQSLKRIDPPPLWFTPHLQPTATL